MSRRDWKGVAWAPVRKGVCTVHGTPVGSVTGLCYDCHREQLVAGGVFALPDIATVTLPHPSPGRDNGAFRRPKADTTRAYDPANGYDPERHGRF